MPVEEFFDLSTKVGVDRQNYAGNSGGDGPYDQRDEYERFERC